MQDIKKFKQRLETLKAELSDRIKKIDVDIRHEGITQDWSDQAIERENDEVLESLGQAAAEELSMINQALQRIEDDRYFICSACGNDILAARLDLVPFTSLCVSCAEDRE